MTRRKASWLNLVADFETTTDPEDCRVWAWGIANVDHDPEFQYGNTIEGFVEYIERFDSHIYFHNLGFDMYFILDWLFRNGFERMPESKNPKATARKFPRNGEFSSLIDNMGKVYTITVRWRTGFVTEFRDSLKRIPMPVAAVAKTFDLPILKGSIDYEAYRAPGHKLTTEEVDYLRNDVHIVAMALAIQRDEGMHKLTVGSDALADYKTLGDPKWFRRQFPLLGAEVDTNIRRAYRGGFTYADPRFSGRVLGEGNVYDVNSLYPSVMYFERIPWGVPMEYSDLGTARRHMRDDDLFITKITFGATLKKDHIPCIQIKNVTSFSGTEYLREVEDGTVLWVCSVDLELWEEQYDLRIESCDTTYVFRSTEGLFREYIDKWGAVKENSEGGRRAIAKLFLNSLYGKFATNPDCTGKVPTMEDNVVKLVRGPEESREPVYTAAGVFITAYARCKTIRAAQAHYGQFAYADTDSLHLVGEAPKDLDIHPKRLGAWKHEYRFKSALFARAKAYTEVMHDDDFCMDCGKAHWKPGEWETHIAGLPRSVQHDVRFEDYQTGKTFAGKLTPVRVPGGVVLKDVGFTLAKVLPGGLE